MIENVNKKNIRRYIKSITSLSGYFSQKLICKLIVMRILVEKSIRFWWFITQKYNLLVFFTLVQLDLNC